MKMLKRQKADLLLRTFPHIVQQTGVTPFLENLSSRDYMSIDFTSSKIDGELFSNGKLTEAHAKALSEGNIPNPRALSAWTVQNDKGVEILRRGVPAIKKPSIGHSLASLKESLRLAIPSMKHGNVPKKAGCVALVKRNEYTMTWVVEGAAMSCPFLLIEGDLATLKPLVFRALVELRREGAYAK